MMFASITSSLSARLLMLCAVAILSGCAADRATPAPGPSAQRVEPQPISNTDACAMRLHDLSGGLLLYQFLNGRLPDTLVELADLGQGPPMPEAVCPVSGLPYTYRPEGFYLPQRQQRIVLYDPAPSHAGLRWAVSVDDGDGTSPLVTKVIAVPESFFVLHPQSRP